MKLIPNEPLPGVGGSTRRRRLLFLILALTLVRGVLYLAVFPPWQHYDEPTHFEYVRLIADRGRLPLPGDYDLAMRREIASSMQAAGFWKDQGAPSLDFWSETPPAIGFSELEHPPLYYALLALPQALAAHQGVELQLYLARFLSVLFYLVVVASAFGLVAEVFPRRQMLPVAVAAFIALLPPLADVMSAVNNDTGAAAAASVLLWASVRLIRRGPSLARVSVTLLMAGICIATKRTAGVVAVAVLPVVAVGYVPHAQRRWLWAGLALLLPAALLAIFSWGGHAAYWQSQNQPAAANRVVTDAVLGRSVFVLSAEGQDHPRVLFQELITSEGQNLRGRTVTLGAWLKAAKGSAGTVTLMLDDGPTEHWHQVKATSDWQFQAFTVTVGVDAPSVAVYAILPKRQDGADKVRAAEMVYLDGVVLVDGEMPGMHHPQFETAGATSGWWGSQQFTNLVRNGSAERIWPGLRTWIGNLNMYRYPISHIFHSLWDWGRTGQVYGWVLSSLLQSFWGRFGWNDLGLPLTYSYLLGMITAAGIVGTATGLVRAHRSGTGARWRDESWQGRVWAVLGVALLVGWSGAIFRIHPLLVTMGISWPVARYATVVIVPTATLLCFGLAEIVPRRWLREAAWAGLLGMITLDVVALWTVILPYYYG